MSQYKLCPCYGLSPINSVSGNKRRGESALIIVANELDPKFDCPLFTTGEQLARPAAGEERRLFSSCFD